MGEQNRALNQTSSALDQAREIEYEQRLIAECKEIKTYKLSEKELESYKSLKPSEEKKPSMINVEYLQVKADKKQIINVNVDDKANECREVIKMVVNQIIEKRKPGRAKVVKEQVLEKTKVDKSLTGRNIDAVIIDDPIGNVEIKEAVKVKDQSKNTNRNILSEVDEIHEHKLYSILPKGESQVENDLNRVIDIKINNLNTEALRLNQKKQAFITRVDKLKDNLFKITNAIAALEEAKTAVEMVESAAEY